MSKKLWVAYEALAKRFGPTRVSIDGCSDVAHFKDEIKKKFEVSGPASHFSLYKSDATTEIDVRDSTTLLADGNSSKNPLNVKPVVSSQVSNLQNSSCSKVSMVMRSTMTTKEKESILKDIFEVQSKEREVQSKDRKVQSLERIVHYKDQTLQTQDRLLELLKREIKRIEAERDFLKGTLDARHIFETYELRFLNPYPQCPKLPRTEKWKKHLVLNPKIREKLEKCDKNILWHDKAAEIYDELCRSRQHRTIDIGNGKYIVVIETSLSKTSSWFLKVLANELYGENVSVQKEIFVEPAYETE